MKTQSSDFDPDEICYEGCGCLAPSCDVSTCACLKRFGKNYLKVDTEVGKVYILANIDKQIKGDLTPPIFECNALCKCGANCNNRLVQNGVSTSLLIFHCRDGRGYGLRTVEALQRGQFVCEYAGQVIGFVEAQRRTKLQQNDMNFIIGVKEQSAETNLITFIDPKHIGNVGRFINHSCDPNLIMIPVRVDSVVVRLALFARRFIAKGEELTFKYGDNKSKPDSNKTQLKKCFCQSDNCYGVLPYDSSLI